MNETPHIPNVIPAKPKRAKRKATTPKTRVIDPGIARLRAAHSVRVSEYRLTTASARIVKTIIEKRLAQLTPLDLEKLFDALKSMVTPALPLQEQGGQVGPDDLVNTGPFPMMNHDPIP